MRRLLGNRKVRRVLQTALALLFVFALLTPAVEPVARAVTQKDIDSLRDNADDLATKKKQLESKLDSLSDSKDAILEKKELLDDKVEILSSQIANAEQQIDDYNNLITQTQAELDAAEQKEEAQYELFCKRVRAMEENGKVSYWSVLFKATNFTDLLSRLDFVDEIMTYDQGVIDELKTLQDQITEKKSSLEDEKASSVAAKTELVSRKAELDTQREQANDLVKQIEQNQSDYQDTLDDISAEEEAIQADIVKKSRELAAQQAAQSGGKTTTAALGGYIWPVSSHKISSPFGSRSSPGGIGSTNHKGVDISGVGYGTEIHAAKAGTVIVSQYSNSYGNYVVISHGSGNTTLYAHMSSRSVSVGQTVAQGDVIGQTGSTGHSTGPHLHFEITENGSRVNPLNYLTDYIQAW
jgi:Membrane proteins related to metalloendopeptidases